MKRYLSTLSFAVLLCLSSQVANAQSHEVRTKFLIDVLGGLAFNEVNAPPAADDTVTNFAYGARLGYQVHKYFGIEGAYIHHDKAALELSPTAFRGTLNAGVENVDVLRWETTSWQLGAKGTWPFYERFYAEARVGIGFWDNNYHRDNPNGDEFFRIEVDGTDVYYGGGIGWNVTKRVTVGVEYTFFRTNVPIADNLSDIGETPPRTQSFAFKSNRDTLLWRVGYRF